MKVTVVLRFKELASDPTKAFLVGSSAWKSDLGKRISTGDVEGMLKHALEHAMALMDTGDDLTITLESSGR